MKKVSAIVLASSIVGLVGFGVAANAQIQAQAAKIVRVVKHAPAKSVAKKSVPAPKAPVAKVSTINGAIAYIMKSSVNTKYRYAEYRFNAKTTYQGQTAYLINVIAKGSKTVTAKYYVLANGNIVLAPATVTPAKSAPKAPAKPVTVTPAKVATIDAAVKFLVSKVNTKYPYAKYLFNSKTTYKGQTAYVIDVFAKGSKSTTASYYVLANGTFVQRW